MDAVCKCITAGLFPNAAYLHPAGHYTTVRGRHTLHIHPSSVLYTQQQPQWYVVLKLHILYHILNQPVQLPSKKICSFN